MPFAPIKGSILLIGSGQHWQAVLKDKDNLWYLCEKHSAKAIQSLSSLLKGRIKHGAVYIVGEHEQLPDKAYVQKFFSHIEKTASTDHDSPSRPEGEPAAKRQKKWSLTLDALVGSKKMPQGRQTSKAKKQAEATHVPLSLPADFEANPDFTFRPATEVEDAPDTQRNAEEEAVVTGEDKFQALLEAFTQSVSQGTPSKKSQAVCVHDKVRGLQGSPLTEPTRPSRQRNRPLLYQSEMEEEREKHIKEVQYQSKSQPVQNLAHRLTDSQAHGDPTPLHEHEECMMTL